MKKIITLGLTSAVVLSIGTTAFAATPVQAANFTSPNEKAIYKNIGTYPNFIDEDGDGICDNTGLYIGSGRGKGINGGRFVDNNGDGLNDNIGSGAGGYFTDANGDGECDNAGTAQGTNRGQGQRMGQARNRS